MAKQRDDAPPQNHPSIDRTNRFAVDQLLRDNGFRIAHRPRKAGSEADWDRWEKGHWTNYKQSAALKTLDRNAVCDALYHEELLQEGFA